jgi:hypothetical protein
VTGHDRARLTPERAKAVRARLAQGYTVSDIKRAIDGCVASEFHTTGGYDDLTLICRNGSKLEAFMSRASEATTHQYEDSETDRLLTEMRKARDDGDQQAWERINSKIQDLRKHSSSLPVAGSNAGRNGGTVRK